GGEYPADGHGGLTPTAWRVAARDAAGPTRTVDPEISSFISPGQRGWAAATPVRPHSTVVADCGQPSEPAASAEDAVQDRADGHHEAEGERISVPPSRLRHRLEVHPVDARDQGRRGDQRRHRGDL